MSWDISLLDPVTKKTLTSDVKHDIKGGTYCLGGTNNLWLNITYNYGPIYHEHGLDINEIAGKEAVDVIPVLDKVISELKDDVNDDYWQPTEGNAKKALIGLRALFKLRPDGVIDVC